MSLFDPNAWQPPKPTQACSACGGPAYGPICGDCQDQRDREVDSRRRLVAKLRVIPERYRDADFTNRSVLERRVMPHARWAIAAAQSGLEHHLVVVLMGSPGSGKSTIAGAMLRGEAERGRTISWAPAKRLAVARSEARLGQEPEEVREAIRAQVTVLDDLGDEAILPTSAVLDVLFERHDAQRPLIAIVTRPRLELATKYGGGAARRLFEKSRVIDLSAAAATP